MHCYKKLSVKEESESALRQQEIIKIIITDRFYIFETALMYYY